MELCGVTRAAGHTQAAADASFGVYNKTTILLRDSADLASLLAQSARGAPLGINGGVIVRLSDRVLDAPVGDSAKYAATAAAAIADIADIAEE
jgi:hypothetical protein